MKKKKEIENMNGKYLISNNWDKVVVVKKDFYKDFFISWRNKLPIFNPEKDLGFINSEKFNIFPENIDKLKWLKKGFFPEDKEKPNNWFILWIFEKIFSESKIHSKWETTIFKNNWDIIYEINSLKKIDDFWDNFLQYKEFAMFSNSNIISNNLNDLLWNFIETNIDRFDSLINVQQGVSFEDKMEWLKVEDFYEGMNFNWIYEFIKSINKLKNWYFYWINQDIYLYYFKKTKSWLKLLKPELNEERNWDIVFRFEEQGLIYQYYNILKQVDGVKYFESKKWDEYVFWLDFYKFKWIELI